MDDEIDLHVSEIQLTLVVVQQWLSGMADNGQHWHIGLEHSVDPSGPKELCQYLWNSPLIQYLKNK